MELILFWSVRDAAALYVGLDVVSDLVNEFFEPQQIPEGFIDVRSRHQKLRTFLDQGESVFFGDILSHFLDHVFGLVQLLHELNHRSQGRLVDEREIFLLDFL